MKVRMRIFAAALLVSSIAGLATADLAKRIGAIISQPSQKNVEFSIRIVSADSGRAVYRHNAYKALVPASNTKIIIAAAALEYLGQLKEVTVLDRYAYAVLSCVRFEIVE